MMAILFSYVFYLCLCVLLLPSLNFIIGVHTDRVKS